MKKRGEVVTIRDVAELAGVSTATAARAMGQYGSVSPDARRRVKGAADSLAYVPNAIAKSMRNQRTKTLGVVIGDIRAPFFNKLVCAIEAVANREGYNVLICNTNERPEKELTHLKSLFERRVDGVVVSSTQRMNAPLSEAVRFYYESDTPLVMVDRRIDGLSRPLVQCDNLGGSYRAAKYLLELGHRRIGVLASNRFINSTRERVEGFRRALEEYGLPFQPELVRYCEESHITEVGRMNVQTLLNEHPGITALYLLNDPLYRSAWFELKARGARFPDDISVLGWGDVELAEAWDITAVTQPIAEIGTCAAEVLFDLIHARGGTPNREILFETALIHRSSCARPRTEPDG